MRRKKRDHGGQPFCSFKLVGIYELRMDYNRAQRADYGVLFNRRFKTVQKLLCRRVAVAVCKQLAALLCG